MENTDWSRRTEESRAVLERLREEQRSRWAAGDRVSVEELLRGQFGGNPDVERALICSEFRLRKELGETPDAAEYLRRYPQHATELRRLFNLHRAGGSLRVADGRSGSRAPVLTSETDDSHSEQSPAGWQPASARSGHRRQILMQSEHANRVLGNYELLEKLGAGGMGEVYRAVHSSDDLRQLRWRLFEGCSFSRSSGLDFRDAMSTSCAGESARRVDLCVPSFAVDRILTSRSCCGRSLRVSPLLSEGRVVAEPLRDRGCVAHPVICRRTIYLPKNHPK